MIASGPRWALGLVSGTLVVLAVWGWLTWPDVAALADRPPASTAFMDRDRANGQSVTWSWSPLRDVSPELLVAVLVAEDIEFFSHGGFSASEIRAAVFEALRDRERPRGASTITQQLAKNLWLSPSRTAGRKFREALLALDLERSLSKHRILELYVNVAQFGPGVYGAEAAARTYFGKPAGALGRREAALLAAALPRPSHWHPGVESGAYLARTDRISALTRDATFLWRRLGVDVPPDALPFPLPGDPVADTLLPAETL